MAVPMLDLPLQHKPLLAPMRQVFDDIITTGQFVLGKRVEQLERELEACCQCRHAIGVSSGTDALIMALMAMDIKAGDEVITTPFTFFATAGSIARVGAKPVFVDVDPVTMNLDPTKLFAAITPRTRAIMPVHLFGLCCDMDPILTLARRHNLHVIEDTAQAIAATYKGKQAGGMGDVGCLSFYPTKNLSACGDAGACLAQNDTLAARLRKIRLHGESSRYHHDEIGGNFRIDALQAALISVKMPHLAAWTQARRRNAEGYCRRLASLPIMLPSEPQGYTHVYHQYTIRVPADRRDALKEQLTKKQIGFGVFYPVPLHLQPCFAYLGVKVGSLPCAEQAAREVLSLPIYPGLTDAQLDEVAGAIREFFR
ncbi:MAG: DegT/DnrJ/EryC1/StrS family aminotransferase [Phycisphaeraceae bacterium]|nr:DegT/DnrJ/EryC1/StrS family aminotransferase [Phycisphaeraceae bacterium]